MESARVLTQRLRSLDWKSTRVRFYHNPYEYGWPIFEEYVRKYGKRSFCLFVWEWVLTLALSFIYKKNKSFFSVAIFGSSRKVRHKRTTIMTSYFSILAFSARVSRHLARSSHEFSASNTIFAYMHICIEKDGERERERVFTVCCSNKADNRCAACRHEPWAEWHVPDLYSFRRPGSCTRFSQAQERGRL